MSRKPRVHFDATRAGNVARQALCGFIDVDTTNDPTEVTCEVCRRRLRSAVPKSNGARGRGYMAESELSEVLADAVRAAGMAPSAGPPPVMTAPLWEASCRGGIVRRCGSCVICVWEREAEKWWAVSPWNRKHQARRPAGAPAWPSLTAALLALVDWEHHARQAPSALGPVLERLKAGAHSDGGANRPEDPMLRRAAEMVRVRQALEGAYPEAGLKAHALDGGTAILLTRAMCMRVLLLRTEGVLPVMPTYDELAVEMVVHVGDLKAVVRNGRRNVTVELAARGLIPMPKPTLGLAELIEAARSKLSEVVHG